MGQNRFHVVQDETAVRWKRCQEVQCRLPALLQANPGVDPYVPRAGSVLRPSPADAASPDAPREGLVINLAELRLYYYPPGKNEVTVYPIGIGQLGGTTITPTMVTTVSDKRANPIPDTYRQHSRAHKAMGIELPAVELLVPTIRWAITPSASRRLWRSLSPARHQCRFRHRYARSSSGSHSGLRDNDIKALVQHYLAGHEGEHYHTRRSRRRLSRMAAVWLRSISRCLEHIDDDPQTLPITLNAAMTAFKRAPQTDGTVMERAMDYRLACRLTSPVMLTPGPQSL